MVESPVSEIRMGKPRWLRRSLPSGPEYEKLRRLIQLGDLHTVCQEAKCPNQFECYGKGTATFMILGDRCTRNCRFCAVQHRPAGPPDPAEPERVATAVVQLGLRYAVITSVTRDDLADGGAAQFAAAVRAVRAADPDIRVEVLVPDFGGDARALGAVLDAGPAVLNHNIETPEAVYPRIGRPLANYRRSLGLLREAKARGATTKSGLMIGLGETREEIARALEDLRQAGCDLLTVGQYLQPSRNALPAARYYAPAEFEEIAGLARGLGFREAAAGPLVRSSYHAQRLSATLPPRT